MKLLVLNMLLSLMLTSQACQLLVKIPTRSRPESFFRALDLYYKNLSGEIDVNFLITCDIDDESMNNEAVIRKLSSYNNLFFYFSKNSSKIEAYNKDIEKHLDFDAILVTSDDTRPSKNYDKKIISLLASRFPDFDGVLNFNDGHDRAERNTLPVLGKKFYDRFGYVYYPEYISFFCDDEVTLISKKTGREIYCDEVIIEHIHPMWRTAPNDALYERNKVYYDHDHDIFYKRKKLGLIYC